jgi:hypothetical protein
MKINFYLVAAACFISGALWADSDLYWCNTSAFLAFDVRPGFHDDSKDHEIRVVSLNGSATRKFIIPDGQVHRMVCKPASIELIQYEGLPAPGGYIQHRIGLDGKQTTQQTSWKLPQDVPGQDPPSFAFVQRDSNGVPMPEVPLTGSPYRLVFQSANSKPCQRQLTVLLHSPKGSDRKVIETFLPTECGE